MTFITFVKSMLSLKNVTIKIDKKDILKDISFDFEKGKVYAVMGPNGSGKSTLANIIMGHPGYKVNSKSKIEFLGKDISDLSADKRAQKGIFLSFQSPLTLGGVRVNELLQLALLGQKDPLRIRNQVLDFAKELKISQDLLARPLNENASGGEKKKMEVLQAAVLDKKLLIFDEVDTGVDVDALRTIAKFLHKHKKDKTYIVITHYNRILHHLRPDKVLVITEGKLRRVGDYRLAQKIEKIGYDVIL